MGGRTKYVEADPDFVARDLWTTLARDYSFGSSTLIFGRHVDRALVRWFSVADRCWSGAFPLLSCHGNKVWYRWPRTDPR